MLNTYNFRTLFISASLFIFTLSNAFGHGISAQRFSNESFGSAKARVLHLHKELGKENFWLPFFLSPDQQDQTEMEMDSVMDSALSRKTNLSELNLNSIPEVENTTILNQLFVQLRDNRTYTWDKMSNFLRRIPWLYPFDGCYLRAQLISENTKNLLHLTPYKVFAFGDLQFTDHDNQINWWYHVASLLRVGSEVFVLDPTIESKKPLTIQDWASKIHADPLQAQFSICKSGTISPIDSCDLEESAWNTFDETSTLQDFLEYEWNYVSSSFGSDPEKTLGDFPPWLQ